MTSTILAAAAAVTIGLGGLHGAGRAAGVAEGPAPAPAAGFELCIAGLEIGLGGEAGPISIALSEKPGRCVKGGAGASLVCVGIGGFKLRI